MGCIREATCRPHRGHVQATCRPRALRPPFTIQLMPRWSTSGCPITRSISRYTIHRYNCGFIVGKILNKRSLINLKRPSGVSVPAHCGVRQARPSHTTGVSSRCRLQPVDLIKEKKKVGAAACLHGSKTSSVRPHSRPSTCQDSTSPARRPPARPMGTPASNAPVLDVGCAPPGPCVLQHLLLRSVATLSLAAAVLAALSLVLAVAALAGERARRRHALRVGVWASWPSF